MTQQTTTKYRIRNWAEYNRALVQRGSLTIWFSEDALEKWLAEKEDKRGRPKVYSNEAILCALMLKAVYNVPFRALRGLLLSLVVLPIPCYTRICRRAKALGQQIKKLSHKRPTDIVFGSTGLKVFDRERGRLENMGQAKGEHGEKSLAVCPDSHDIILECMTSSSVADYKIIPKMRQKKPQKPIDGKAVDLA